MIVISQIYKQQFQIISKQKYKLQTSFNLYMLDIQNQYPHPYNREQIQKLVSGKCICQACNCGKHHCPAPHHKGYYNSSYGESYTKYDVKPNPYQRPKHTIQQSHYNPDQIQSSYQTNYKQPPQASNQDVNKYKNIHKNFILPTDSFKGESSYSDAYRNKNFNPADLRAPMPKSNNMSQKYRFEGTSSYENDYIMKNAQRPQKFVLKNNLGPSDKKFDGQSSYFAEFQNKGGQPVQKYVQKGQLQLSNSRFQGSSSYNAQYANKGVPVKTQRVPQIKNQILPQGRFEGDSTYHQNFIPSKPGQNKQFRPNDELKVGGLPFQGQSSYLGDYANKGSPIKAQRAPQVKNQILPEGQFQGDSTYHANFLGSKVQRNPQFRPNQQLKVGGSFQGVSSYSKDYLNQGPPIRAQRSQQIKNQIMPQGRFQGDSTYHSNYLGSTSQKNPQFRPQQQLKVGGKFQGASSYQNDYKMTKSPTKAICPTDILKAPKYQSGDKQHIRYNASKHNWQ